MLTPSLLGLSHVALSVRDRPAARGFWARVLGFDLVADEADHTFLLDRGAGLAVVLTDHGGTVASPFDERRTGLDHLAYAVPDLESLRSWEQRLAALGVPHSPVAETGAGYHLNLRAPDELPLELFVMKPEFLAALGLEEGTAPVARVR